MRKPNVWTEEDRNKPDPAFPLPDEWNPVAGRFDQFKKDMAAGEASVRLGRPVSPESMKMRHGRRQDRD